MNVSFNPLAERELNDAAHFYEIETPGLGATFLADVQRCCRQIVEFPESGIVISPRIRRRLTSRFPYAILYTVRPDTVRILAVMNLKRRPTYWIGRS